MINWKSYFKKDIENKYKLMINEYSQYENTDNIDYLQQAGNKLFNIVKNYLQVKYNKRMGTYNELKLLVRNNKNNYELLLESAQLRYFFYNGELQMQRDEAEHFYKKVLQKINSRLKIGVSK